MYLLIKSCFWLSVLFIVYPLAIYPALVYVIGLIRPRPVKRRAWIPSVTVLIPAYNEAQHIAATVQNKLDQDYPTDRLQIIVVSDGSTDSTDDIVRGFASRGVQLIRLDQRQGKAVALNEGVRHANGEILVFNDANSLFAPDGIRRLVENFADPEVGNVCGSLTLEAHGADAAGVGCVAYNKYEHVVRMLETRAGSIIGVNGGVDAVRKELYRDVPKHLITDLVLPLEVIRAKRRVVYDGRVQSFEVANSDIGSEFRMRVRVALRGLQGLAYMRPLLNPVRYPWVAFSLLSHKALRYFSFVFLLIASVTNPMLSSTRFHAVLFVIQVILYVSAFAGLRKDLPRIVKKWTAIPTYFVMFNLAFAVAAIKFLRGETMATWQPRAGAQPSQHYNQTA